MKKSQIRVSDYKKLPDCKVGDFMISYEDQHEMLKLLSKNRKKACHVSGPYFCVGDARLPIFLSNRDVDVKVRFDKANDVNFLFEIWKKIRKKCTSMYQLVNQQREKMKMFLEQPHSRYQRTVDDILFQVGDEWMKIESSHLQCVRKHAFEIIETYAKPTTIDDYQCWSSYDSNHRSHVVAQLCDVKKLIYLERLHLKLMLAMSGYLQFLTSLIYKNLPKSGQNDRHSGTFLKFEKDGYLWVWETDLYGDAYHYYRLKLEAAPIIDVTSFVHSS